MTCFEVKTLDLCHATASKQYTSLTSQHVSAIRRHASALYSTQCFFHPSTKPSLPLWCSTCKLVNSAYLKAWPEPHAHVYTHTDTLYTQCFPRKNLQIEWSYSHVTHLPAPTSLESQSCSKWQRQTHFGMYIAANDKSGPRLRLNSAVKLLQGVQNKVNNQHFACLCI